MRPAELPLITLTPECAAEIRAARLERFNPRALEINGRAVALQGWSPRMDGSLGSVFLTYDGKWWRVETRLETFEKRKNRALAQAAFLRMAIPCPPLIS
jgi:hypothetical protein